MCLCVMTHYIQERQIATPRSAGTLPRRLTKPLYEVTVMAGSQHTQTRPEFTWRFLSTSERYPTAKPLVIYVKDTYIEYWGEIFVSARIIEFGITFERFLKDPWKHLMSCGQESAPDSIAEGMLPLLPAQAEVARRVRENELRQLAFQRELLSRPEKKHSNNIKPIFIANKTTCWYYETYWKTVGCLMAFNRWLPSFRWLGLVPNGLRGWQCKTTLDLKSLAKHRENDSLILISLCYLKGFVE